MDSVTAVIKALKEMKRVCKKSGRIIFDFRNSLNPLLKAKYKLARYYDPTVKNLPLNTYSPGQIEKILKDLNLKIVSRKFIGLPFKRLAPVIIMVTQRTQ
jgi:ubiquinone/menaquinone biosynthesis C-methylase UbiE